MSGSVLGGFGTDLGEAVVLSMGQPGAEAGLEGDGGAYAWPFDGDVEVVSINL
jgi:hypothetical protein